MTRLEQARERLHGLRLPWALATAEMVGESDAAKHEGWLLVASDGDIVAWANSLGFRPVALEHRMASLPLNEDQRYELETYLRTVREPALFCVDDDDQC